MSYELSYGTALKLFAEGHTIWNVCTGHPVASLAVSSRSGNSWELLESGNSGKWSRVGSGLIGGVQCGSISHEVQHVQPAFQQDEQARRRGRSRDEKRSVCS